MSSSKRGQFLDQMEEVADQVLRRGKHLVPTAARLCLISTYLEDGLRMWVQWTDQSDYIQHQWQCPAALGHLFVLVNLVGQLFGCGMVLVRYRVSLACCVLAFILLLQSVAYSILWDTHFLLRNLAVSGGIVLLYVESRAEGRSMFAGLPSLGDSGPKQWLQLSGRLLLVLMFVTLARMDSALQALNFCFDLLLVLLIAVGYKTKLCALITSAKLLVVNCLQNPWWYHEASSASRDFLKFDFFQTMSVIGGLLMVVAIGPGGVSLDERKKRF